MIAPPAFIHPPALGGQYGQHNPDHHCSSVACRRRFLWPRTVVLSSEFAYIGGMLSRNSRGRPINAPAAFIHPCRPIVVSEPPSGPGWAHELKHDGYRLQIHVRDGRVRLYTINGANWSKRYPLIVRDSPTAFQSALHSNLFCHLRAFSLLGSG